MCTQVLADVSTAFASACTNWFPRLSFDPKVPCICGSTCEEHKIVGCVEMECLHLIKLGKFWHFEVEHHVSVILLILF